MAFTALELRHVRQVLDRYRVDHRPPPRLRDKLDLSYRVVGQSIEIYETSPHSLKKGKTIEHSVAKATYVHGLDQWRIYWKRANGRWYGYEPKPTAETIQEFLDVIELDVYGCFNG